MALKLITPPVGYPVTLTEAKSQARVDGTDSDAALNGMIAAATNFVEDYTGQALFPQTWALYLDSFSPSIQIPKNPVLSVTSVQYYDVSNVLQTIDPANYAVDLISKPQWIVPVTGYVWPLTPSGVNNVIITFVAGLSTIPSSVHHALLLLISSWFDDRDRGSIPDGVMALLSNHRSF